MQIRTHAKRLARVSRCWLGGALALALATAAAPPVLRADEAVQWDRSVPVGNTVDVANATWSNTIGDPELITVWTNPDFDPAEPAVYYARVMEIPTPRWTAYDAKYFDVEMADEIPMITTERAYTSPIWYTP